MASFQFIQPSPELSPYIKHYWVLETDFLSGNIERIVPIGTIQLFFYRGFHQVVQSEKNLPSSLLSGQTTQYFDLKSSGSVRLISVVFYPHTAYSFFKIPMGELADQQISASDLNDTALKELENKVINTDNSNHCISFIEEFLIKRLYSGKHYNFKRIASTIQAINQQKGCIRISDLANNACLSNKQFQRIFSSHIGVTPKEFLRTIRFQYALFVLQQNPTISFSQLAYECGYYDQPHFINEFKQFSGYTPKEYLHFEQVCSDYFS